ncbi:MAG: glycosyltransferase family 39 protein [Planctomycetota bacterium]
MTPSPTIGERESEVHHSSGAPWGPIAVIVVAGVALRALMLGAALPVDLQSDESNYVYAAVVLERLGFFVDHQRYLWPPAHPWLVAKAIGAFGSDGLDAIRWLHVALSSVIGATTMLFAWRLFSRRAAVVAGILWAVHLPMAAYTHFLWSEPLLLALLLTALWNLLRALDAIEGSIEASIPARLIASGALFGAALYVKELPLYLVPLAGLIVFVRSWGAGPGLALNRALLVPLTAFVVVLPWTLRNVEVYDRVVLGGSTLGENAYVGVNAEYMNFDFVPLRKKRVAMGLEPIEAVSRPSFTSPPPAEEGSRTRGWPRRDDVVHVIDRQSAQLREALAYAASHPSWTLRTRIKKLSDFFTPLSFLLRSYALGNYAEESAMNGPPRGPIVVWSLALPIALLLLAAGGFFLTLPGGAGRDVVALTITYVAATSLLVAMSRFRVPIEPLIIALAAGFLAHGPATRSVPRIVGCAATVVALVGLWWVSLPETIELARMALGGAG